MFLISIWGTPRLPAKWCPAPSSKSHCHSRTNENLIFSIKSLHPPTQPQRPLFALYCSCPPLKSLESTNNFLASTATSNRYRTCGISCFLGTLRSIFFKFFILMFLVFLMFNGKHPKRGRKMLSYSLLSPPQCPAYSKCSVITHLYFFCLNTLSVFKDSFFLLCGMACRGVCVGGRGK